MPGAAGRMALENQPTKKLGAPGLAFETGESTNYPVAVRETIERSSNAWKTYNTQERSSSAIIPTPT
jgi:hypothetical protein